MTAVGVRVRTFLVEVLAIVATAWAVFLLLRGEVLERYLVATPSMEPTLHGSPVDGDVVLVDKTAFWWGFDDLRRFDLVVVHNRDDPEGNLLVKRFVAAGPATLAIARGDLLLADPVTGRFEPIRKHPVRDADLLLTSFVTAADRPGGIDGGRFVGRLLPAGSGAAGVRVPGRPEAALLAACRTAAAETPRADRAPLPGYLSTARAIDTGFVDLTGELHGVARGFPRDIGLEVDVALDPGCDAVLLVVECLGEFHGVRIARDGHVVGLRDGAPTEQRYAGPTIGDGASHRLAFGHLDERLFVTVDDQLVGTWPADLPLRFRGELRIGEGEPTPLPNRLHVGAAGSEGLVLTRFRAFHDALLRDDREAPYHLEPGELFLLGDNVHDSADSRDRPADPFRLADLVGRPLLVIAPRDRWRWLSRRAKDPRGP